MWGFNRSKFSRVLLKQNLDSLEQNNKLSCKCDTKAMPETAEKGIEELIQKMLIIVITSKIEFFECRMLVKNKPIAHGEKPVQCKPR